MNQAIEAIETSLSIYHFDEHLACCREVESVFRVLWSQASRARNPWINGPHARVITHCGHRQTGMGGPILAGTFVRLTLKP